MNKSLIEEELQGLIRALLVSKLNESVFCQPGTGSEIETSYQDPSLRALLLMELRRRCLVF